MITLDDIKQLESPKLTTLLSKIIYLMIEDKADEEGWASISLREFTEATRHTKKAVIVTLNKLQASGYIEKQSKPSITNQYRTITRKL